MKYSDKDIKHQDGIICQLILVDPLVPLVINIHIHIDAGEIDASFIREQTKIFANALTARGIECRGNIHVPHHDKANSNVRHKLDF